MFQFAKVFTGKYHRLWMGGAALNIEQGISNIEHRSAMQILNIEQGILNIEWKCK
jgi:hypothetical protein